MTERLISLLREKHLKIATAESCTGGLLASKLTSVPGASRVFEYGFVTYSEGAKQKLIGVNEETLRRHSVYSSAVAEEMAIGCMEAADADVGIGITGVAGTEQEIAMVDGVPTTIDPGTVYIACCCKRDGCTTVKVQRFMKNPCTRIGDGFREIIRENASDFAIEIAIEEIERCIDDSKS